MILNKYKLFTSSIFVFMVLNIVENLIHFSIGRNVENKKELTKVNLEMHNTNDIIKIVIVMCIFALLQGLFTCLLDGCFNFNNK